MTRTDKIYTTGKTFFSYPFKVYFLETEAPENTVVISVPKKLFKRAVKRNLLRRRIRESYRLQLPAHPFLSRVDLLIVYRSHEILTYNSIYDGLKDVLLKIQERIEKGDQSALHPAD